MRNFSLAAGAAAALLAASAADATTYVASRPVGSGALDLAITTDGALGVLQDADILDWDITVTQGSDTFTLQGPGGTSNSERFVFGTALTATLSDLLFDFGAGPGNGFLIQAPFIGSSQTFWCVESSGCSGKTPLETISATDFASRTSTPYAGNVVIASVASGGGVPEPQAWALMIAGFGLAGSALRRRAAAA